MIPEVPFRVDFKGCLQIEDVRVAQVVQDRDLVQRHLAVVSFPGPEKVINGNLKP